jgi:hypothetical protein
MEVCSQVCMARNLSLVLSLESTRRGIEVWSRIYRARIWSPAWSLHGGKWKSGLKATRRENEVWSWVYTERNRSLVSSLHGQTESYVWPGVCMDRKLVTGRQLRETESHLETQNSSWGIALREIWWESKCATTIGRSSLMAKRAFVVFINLFASGLCNC